MDKIGIIAAMPEELTEIKKIMNNISVTNFFEKEFITGTIGKKNCVLCLCGIGKVNSARTTQLLIDKFNCTAIINVGSAGALSKQQKVGDIVISTAAVQTDFDITAFGREKGFITGVGKFINADRDLINVLKTAVTETLSKVTVREGIIATADRFVSTAQEKAEINRLFGALCCEMEGAAMAQVCYLCKVPFVILRAISDDLHSKAEVDFEKFLVTASKSCAAYLLKAFEILN